MKNILIALIIFTLVSATSSAQSYSGKRDRFFVGWEVAAPANDFVSKTSYSGGRIDYRRLLKPNVTVGIAGSWNSFDQYVSKTTYQKADGSGAVTSDLVKQVYSVPITLNVHFYPKGGGGGKMLPYAGIGLGTQYSEQTIYFNIYSIEDNNWGFVARPEIGVIRPLNDHIAIYLSAAYNYASNKSDVFKTDNLSHWGFSLGFAF